MSSRKGEKFSYVCGTDSDERKSWNTMSRQIFSKPLRPLVLGTQMTEVRMMIPTGAMTQVHIFDCNMKLLTYFVIQHLVLQLLP